MSTFLGNDYMSRLYSKATSKNRIQHKIVVKLIDSYIAAPDKNEWLTAVESKYYKSQPNSNARIFAAGYKDNFTHIVFLIRHSPVFELVPTGDGDVNILDTASYLVWLVPLNPLPEDVSVHEWGARMGWPSNPCDRLGAVGFRFHPDTYKEVFLLEKWARTGKVLSGIPYPVLKHPPSYECDHCAYVDEEHTPPEHWLTAVLRKWLVNRDMLKKGKADRSLLIHHVKEGLRQEKADPYRAKKPKQRLQVCSGSSYQLLENLVVGKDGIRWNSDPTMLFAIVRLLDTIDQDAIDKWFGIHNGIVLRALARLAGGHYDVSTMEFARAQMRDDGRVVYLFRIKCTPSLKSPPYWTYVAFEAGEGEDGEDSAIPKAYIPYPISRCECPAGCLFCSHMLGFLCVLYLIQKHEDWTLDKLKSALPPPVKSIHSFPMPWREAFGPDSIELAVRCSLNEEDGEYIPSASELESNDEEDSLSEWYVQLL